MATTYRGDDGLASYGIHPIRSIGRGSTVKTNPCFSCKDKTGGGGNFVIF